MHPLIISFPVAKGLLIAVDSGRNSNTNKSHAVGFDI